MQIAECPNYAVSNRGRVLNIARDTYLAQRETDEGSLRVSMFERGQQKDFYVHHLVYRAFFGPLREGDHLMHLDGDKHNNTPENLRFRRRPRVTNRESYPLLDLEEDTGPRHWGRRVMILETGEVFRTVRDLANYIHGDFATIYACLRGERRSHRGLTFAYYTPSEE